MSKEHRGKMTGDPVTFRIPSPAGGVSMETYIPWALVKRGVRREVITPLDTPQVFLAEATEERLEREKAQDSRLLRAIGLAHYWQWLLDDGKCISVTEVARMEGVDVTQVRRLLRLTLLAPTILERLMDSSICSLDSLLRQSLPLEWSSQIRAINVI